jgi:phosphopantothenoylcysteine decarboxylase/phosphopantothenate--cysteine ligase
LLEDRGYILIYRKLLRFTLRLLLMPALKNNIGDNLLKNPLKDIVGSLGCELKDKKVVLCVTGSIAAIESPEIARMLMRYGADVHAAMSMSAQKIIQPEAFEWATGNPVITDLTGKIEHVQLAGEWLGRADLILIAPSTANTIGKIANGIDDTVVTTIATTAIGSGIPLLIVPAMHVSMYKHPALIENIKKLESFGVEFIVPLIREGKAKMPEVQEIVERVIGRLSEKNMRNLKVLIVAGPTIEQIDPVRVITNKSSGKMGMALTKEAFRKGADVKLIYGPGQERAPSYIDCIRVESAEEMFKAVVSELDSGDFDFVVSVAAIADYMPLKRFDYKIVSSEIKDLSLKLKSTPKIIEKVKQANPDIFLIAFKAEYNIKKDELIDKAYEKLKLANADLIVANDVGKRGSGFGEDKSEVFIIDKEKKVVHVLPSLKSEVARKIFDSALKKFQKK